MKTWQCACGTRIYFDNTACNQCGRDLGYDPKSDRMWALDGAGDGTYQAIGGARFRFCNNKIDYGVCNWLLPVDDGPGLCRSCVLNETIPTLLEPARRDWWASMEAAKRRLVYSLLCLNLPLTARASDPTGLGFDFLEDQRSNPHVEEEFVPIGYADGLITVNLAEADAVHRERERLSLGESYRTLLGHFRHESGHYYFYRLVRSAELQAAFHELFGDSNLPYEEALEAYYANAPGADWSGDYISAYAQAHPLEDWAESWAHYLHIVDTLETAAAYGLVSGMHAYMDVEHWMPDWSELTLVLNGLNRSMGLQDAYPFVIGQGAVGKLRFVHHVISGG